MDHASKSLQERLYGVIPLLERNDPCKFVNPLSKLNEVSCVFHSRSSIPDKLVLSHKLATPLSFCTSMKEERCINLSIQAWFFLSTKNNLRLTVDRLRKPNSETFQYLLEISRYIFLSNSGIMPE